MNAIEAQAPAFVLQAQSGDTEAWAGLYRRYSCMVFRTAYLLLGDRQRAEELTQDVWVQVYRNLHTFSPERGAFTTWLHRITVNLCSNTRRQRLLRWLSLDRGELDREALPASTPAVLETILRGEEQREVWQAVQRLPLKLRAAVVLRYYQDLSYEEIAQALSCPIGTVRSRLAAAHARLREVLED